MKEIKQYICEKCNFISSRNFDKCPACEYNENSSGYKWKPTTLSNKTRTYPK